MVNAKTIVECVRGWYQTSEFIPLHAPIFLGNDKKYLNDAIDSTFVSSVGAFVSKFESEIEQYTGANKAVAVVNGTAALHTALTLSNVKRGDIVLTQALTFVATCNAISYLGATPVFVDVDRVSLGLCPLALEAYLTQYADLNEQGKCIHKTTRQLIKAVIPMHTFGHPVDLDKIMRVCQKWHLTLIEDAAESLGSWYKNTHTGTIGDFGAISFNGNKIITTGAGGVLLCKDEQLGARAKHLTTTAKLAHLYETVHDEIGFNYRMPNLNAALGCAQLEKLNIYLTEKRQLAHYYESYFENSNYLFIKEPSYAKSNYWLNAVCCSSLKSRDELLNYTNNHQVATRPVWTLMHQLPMFENKLHGSLINSEWLADRVVNLPSSPSAITHRDKIDET